MEMAMACWIFRSRASGANQMASGTAADSIRPHTPTDTGGLNSTTGSGSSARSGIASVVKQSSSPQDVVENRLPSGVDGNERQADLVIRQQAQALHHVFERDRIGVQEDRLSDREELIMNSSRLVPRSAAGCIAERSNPLRVEIADRVHDPRRADGQHRQAQ